MYMEVFYTCMFLCVRTNDDDAAAADDDTIQMQYNTNEKLYSAVIHKKRVRGAV